MFCYNIYLLSGPVLKKTAYICDCQAIDMTICVTSGLHMLFLVSIAMSKACVGGLLL